MHGKNDMTINQRESDERIYVAEVRTKMIEVTKQTLINVMQSVCVGMLLEITRQSSTPKELF